MIRHIRLPIQTSEDGERCDFWESVRALAKLRQSVPEERRATSAVRAAILGDVLPECKAAERGEGT